MENGKCKTFSNISKTQQQKVEREREREKKKVNESHKRRTNLNDFRKEIKTYRK